MVMSSLPLAAPSSATGASLTLATTAVGPLATCSAAPCASTYLATTSMVLPTSASVRTYVVPVAPETSTPSRCHWYAIVPSPSASASVFAAVSVWPCVAVPLMVTDPVGASLTLATAAVAALATCSAVPLPSVYLATTSMVLPTSASFNT